MNQDISLLISGSSLKRNQRKENVLKLSVADNPDASVEKYFQKSQGRQRNAGTITFASIANRNCAPASSNIHKNSGNCIFLAEHLQKAVVFYQLHAFFFQILYCRKSRQDKRAIQITSTDFKPPTSAPQYDLPRGSQEAGQEYPAQR